VHHVTTLAKDVLMVPAVASKKSVAVRFEWQVFHAMSWVTLTVVS
jgi:hypothetical protein